MVTTTKTIIIRMIIIEELSCVDILLRALNALFVSKYMFETRPILGFYSIKRIVASFSLSHYLIFGCSHSLAVGRVFDNSSVLHKHLDFKEIA